MLKVKNMKKKKRLGPFSATPETKSSETSGLTYWTCFTLQTENVFMTYTRWLSSPVMVAAIKEAQKHLWL